MRTRLIGTLPMSEYRASSVSWIRYTKSIKDEPWQAGSIGLIGPRGIPATALGPSTEQNRIGLHRILADLKFEKGRADDDRSIRKAISLPWLPSTTDGYLPPLPRDPFRALYSPIMERYISGRLLPQTDPFI